MKSVKNMTFNETLDWARGWLLISIGKGDFESATYAIIYAAWTNGYNEGKEKSKNGNAIEKGA